MWVISFSTSFFSSYEILDSLGMGFSRMSSLPSDLRTVLRSEGSEDILENPIPKLSNISYDEKNEVEKEMTHILSEPKKEVLMTHKERSEERRVGKECRSRWSTYQ